MDVKDRNVVDGGGFDWCSCFSRVNAGHGDRVVETCVAPD